MIFNDKLMKDIGKNAQIVFERYYSKKVNKKKIVGIINDLNANP